MSLASKAFNWGGRYQIFRNPPPTDQHCIHEGNKRRRNSGNYYCHSAQTLLFKIYCPKTWKIKCIKPWFCLFFLHRPNIWCISQEQNIALACLIGIYRVIHKPLRDFRPLRYSNRDGDAEGKHVNRGRDTPIFCATLQVLDMSTLGDAADVKFGRFRDTKPFLIPCPRHVSSWLPPNGRTCKYAMEPRKQKQKLGEILYLLIYSFLLCLSWLLGRLVRKFRRDLWITLYLEIHAGESEINDIIMDKIEWREASWSVMLVKYTGN